MKKKTKKKQSLWAKLQKKIKNWATTKTTLYIAIIAVVIYTIIGCLFTILKTEMGVAVAFDATMTSEWFSFWKWVVVSGGTISTVKILKAPSQVDNGNPPDYEYMEENDDEDIDNIDSEE